MVYASWRNVCGSLLMAALLSWAVLGQAQELKCNIQINSQKIQGTNRSVFEAMQKSLYEFLNNTKWTDHAYQEGERIEYTVILTLNEQVGSDEYKGTMNVQSRRPVFASSYQTPIINILDNNVQFKYIENEQLEFNESAHLSNLTSLMAFYAYIILGYDYDTFSPLGGTPYFEKAEQIVNNAQVAPEKGWKAYEGSKKNRYWIVNNMLNDKYRPLRRAMYLYHRRGLDVMYDKLNDGRTQVLQALVEVQKVYRQRPDADMNALHLFLDAKRDEMIGIFSGSPSTEKAKAVNILREIDNANAQRYDEMLKQKEGGR